MKKLLLIFALATPLFFTACSDDDDNGETTGVQKRVTKITYTSEDRTTTAEFKYDESGNLSRWTESLAYSGENNTYIQIVNFIYDGDKLVKTTGVDSNVEFSREYTHRNDSIFTGDTFYNQYAMALKDNYAVKKIHIYETEAYEYDSNKNLQKMTFKSVRNGQEEDGAYIITYTHDNKKSAFSNQGNFPAWYWSLIGHKEFAAFNGANNMLTMKECDVDGEGVEELLELFTYTYEYNEDGLPVTCKVTRTDGVDRTVVFEYEEVR